MRPSREKLKVDIEELKLELDESGLVIILEVVPRNDALRAAEILRDLMRRESKENKVDQHLRGVFN